MTDKEDVAAHALTQIANRLEEINESLGAIVELLQESTYEQETNPYDEGARPRRVIRVRHVT